MNHSNLKNPIEELKQNLQDILKNPNVSIDLKAENSNTLSQSKESTKERNASSSNNNEKEILKRIRRFNMKPKEVYEYLNRFVIQQNEAKKVLSVSICDHYNHVRQCIEDPKLIEQEYGKPNILIIGPTGVGKTYLMRNVAKLIGVPFVRADATKFSETGEKVLS